MGMALSWLFDGEPPPLILSNFPVPAEFRNFLFFLFCYSIQFFLFITKIFFGFFFWGLGN